MMVGRDSRDAGGESVCWLGLWMIPEMFEFRKGISRLQEFGLSKRRSVTCRHI